MTELVINQKFRAVGAGPIARQPTEAVLKAAEMFGIGLDETYEVTLYEDLRLDVRPGDVVFVTGPSGSGKSVLLARLEEAVCRAPSTARAVSLAGIDLSEDRPAYAGRSEAGCGPRRPVIDLLGGPLDRRLRLLSTAGLADAFLLLRTPAELSDGQRYRLRLARAIEILLFGDEEETRPASGAAKQDTPGRVLVADEFCSTLDRLCARAIAYRVRRLADAEGITVLAASAHDDLVEDLAPDVLVVKHEARRVEVRYADPAREVKP